MNKKILSMILVVGMFSLVSLISLTGTVEAQQVSYCCEKTNDGAWCQNADQSQCDESYDSAPTSCDSTSFCQLGVWK